MKKIFVILFMMFVVGGCSCSNEQCECPEDEGNSEVVYEDVVSDYSELYRSTVTSVVKITVTKGTYEATGSGVVFYQEGDFAYILTNAHVVKDVNNTYDVEVIFSDSDGFENGESEIVPASKIYKNANEDVAVLEIPVSEKYTVAQLGDSNQLNKGDFVYAIGSPFGKFNYMTGGYISSYNVPVTLNTSPVTSYVIITDTAINEGNSGGALFNKEGKLIGITTFRYDQINGKEVHEMYGSLPINHVVKVAKKIMTGQTYVRPAIGYTMLSVNEMGANRNSYGIAPSVTGGVYVASGVDSGANLTIGSIITHVNDVEVKSLNDFYVELLKYDVGSTVSLTLITKDGLTSRVQTITLHS